MSHGINLTENSLFLDEKIYRIIPMKRFYELFDNQENVLVRPRLWEDPFENRVMTSIFEGYNGSRIDIGFKNNYYAQCWSHTSISDAMWRIYSSETKTDGIRIRTSVGKLLKSLVDSTGSNFADISCFIGKVEYLTDIGFENKCKELLENIFDSTNQSQTKSLLLKRFAFKHEDEVRLIYSPPNDRVVDDNIYKYNIFPNSLIEQVMLHPMLTSKEAERWKKRISNELGYPIKNIKHSLLYTPPKALSRQLANV